MAPQSVRNIVNNSVNERRQATGQAPKAAPVPARSTQEAEVVGQTQGPATPTAQNDRCEDTKGDAVQPTITPTPTSPAVSAQPAEKVVPRVEDIPVPNGRHGWEPWCQWSRDRRLSQKISKVLRHFIDRWNATAQFYAWQATQKKCNQFREQPIDVFIEQMMNAEKVFLQDKHLRDELKENREFDKLIPAQTMKEALDELHEVMHNHRPQAYMQFTDYWDECFWIELIQKTIVSKVRFSIITYAGPIAEQKLDHFIRNRHGRWTLNVDAMKKQREYNRTNGNKTYLRAISGHSENPDAPIASLSEDPSMIPLTPYDTEILCFNTDEDGLAGILDDGWILAGGPNRVKREIYFKDFDHKWGDDPNKDPWLRKDNHPDRNPNVWPVHYHSGKYSHMNFLVRTNYSKMYKDGVIAYKSQGNGASRIELDAEAWPILVEIRWRNPAGQIIPVFLNWTEIHPDRVPDYAKETPNLWGFNTPGFPACCIPKRVPTEHLGLMEHRPTRMDIPRTPTNDPKSREGNVTPRQTQSDLRSNRRPNSREPKAKPKPRPPPLPPKSSESSATAITSDNPALDASIGKIKASPKEDLEAEYINMRNL